MCGVSRKWQNLAVIGQITNESKCLTLGMIKFLPESDFLCDCNKVLAIHRTD